jgi:UDP-N-acetylmuramoyl-L-alanyl-D-glutamate--2,6-diaminopimelate ligase
MKLSTLAEAITNAKQHGGDPEITGIAYDSRLAGPGSLFVALRGKNADGHVFIPAALAQGATAVVVDNEYGGDLPDVPHLTVPNCRAAMPRLSAALYGGPSLELTVVGVTGTNGKTSTTYMLDSIFKSRGEKTGVIGTLGAIVAGEEIPQERTTPESPDLQRLLRRMVDAGVVKAVMEVSSEGALMERTTGLAYDVGIFTNLTQDHLNTHGDMESYFAQKLRLFTEYPAAFPQKVFTAVVNADDSYGQRVLDRVRKDGRPSLSFSLQGDADITAQVKTANPVSTLFALGIKGNDPIDVNLPMGGLFSVANALAASGAAYALGLTTVEIKVGLEELKGVPRWSPLRASVR